MNNLQRVVGYNLKYRPFRWSKVWEVKKKIMLQRNSLSNSPNEINAKCCVVQDIVVEALSFILYLLIIVICRYNHAFRGNIGFSLVS